MTDLVAKQQPNASKPETIVIPIVAGIGNALMADPMVRQLRDARPASRIVVVALIAPMAAVFQGIERVETIVTGRGLKNLLSGVRSTRRLRPDVYLVPFPSNRWQYNVLAAASGAKRVVLHGYPIGRWSALGILHRDRVPAQRGIHDVVQNLRLLEKLGIQPKYERAPRFIPSEPETMAAAERLRSIGLRGVLSDSWHGCLTHGLCSQDTGEAPVPQLQSSHSKGATFVVLHAGSAKTILAQAKRWPNENYANVAQRLVAEHDLDVLIVEGPDEVGVSDEILTRCASRNRIHAMKLTGPLGQSAAILASAAFYVGTDSGLAHLSAAVGVPAITLFAPADPDRVCPFGYRDLVVQPPDGKAPTFLYPWQATKPKLPADEVGRITLISVEQVMEKVRIQMRGKGQVGRG